MKRRIYISFAGCDAIGKDFSVFTSRSVKTVEAQFDFDSAWDEYETKTAIFANGSTVISQLLNAENSCTVPWEVLSQSGGLVVGVVGQSGEKIMPSVQVIIPIVDGIYTEGTTPSEPTPDVYEQIVQIMQETRDIAQSVRDDADAGKFNGGGSGGSGEDGATFTPHVDADGNLSWTNDKGLENPETVNIKGADGVDGANGANGKDGTDGVSATHNWNGTVLTVTSASGTTSADLKGEKGDKGDTGAQGEKGADGTDGTNGEDGYTPQKGVDYFDGADGKDGVGISSVEQTTISTEDNGENVVTVTLTNGEQSTFVVRNGSKGADGADGEGGSTDTLTDVLITKDGKIVIMGQDAEYSTIAELQEALGVAQATDLYKYCNFFYENEYSIKDYIENIVAYTEHREYVPISFENEINSTNGDIESWCLRGRGHYNDENGECNICITPNDDGTLSIARTEIDRIAPPTTAEVGQILAVESVDDNGKPLTWTVVDKLANGEVTATKIADGNVTTAKIQNVAVTTAKIADANVTKAKLATSVQITLTNADTMSADSGWKTQTTFREEWAAYDSTDQPVQYRKVGKTVQIRGAITNVAAITGGITGIAIFTLPTGYRPSQKIYTICQGEGIAQWMLTVYPTGVIYFSRYGKGNGWADLAENSGAWIRMDCTFLID